MKIFLFKMNFLITSLIFSLFFFNGCTAVSHGRSTKLHLKDLEKIEIGVTTKDEITELFGKPQKILYKPNNIEAYVYSHGIERRVYIPFIISWGRAGGTGETLVISFQDDKVINFEFTVDQ